MANEYIVGNDTQISGSLSVSQSVTAETYYGDGSHLTGVVGSQWNGIFTGSVEISGSLRVEDGNVDFRLATGVSGSFSGTYQGNGSGLTNLNLNGYQASGSNFTGSFTGSFAGDGSKLTGITASYYNGPTLNAISASYAYTASYYNGSVISASYATTASYSATASYFAGSIESSQTASYVNPLKQQVQITGSLDILGTETVSSTLQVGGKIQSQTGIDILNPNGVYWKDSSFGATALGGVSFDKGITFYASNLVTPRLFISESGNIGIGTVTPTLAKLQVAGNVHATSFTGSFQGTATNTALQTGITSNITVGGATAPTTFTAGTSLEYIIRTMLVTYIAPTIGTFSILNVGTTVLSANVIAEVSSSYTFNTASFTSVADNPNSRFAYSASFTASGANIGNFTHFFGNDVLGSTNALPLGSLRTVNRSTDGTVTFTLRGVNPETSAIISEAKTATYVYPYYYGISPVDYTSTGNVSASLSQLIETSGTKEVSIAGTAGYVYFCYPASYADLSLIEDGNSYDITTDFDLITRNQNGTPGKWSGISYKIYKHKTLTTLDPAQKFIFTL